MKYCIVDKTTNTDQIWVMDEETGEMTGDYRNRYETTFRQSAYGLARDLDPKGEWAVVQSI